MDEMKKFKRLSPEVQESLRNKARWERMSLTAVMLEWPELWKTEEYNDEDMQEAAAGYPHSDH